MVKNLTLIFLICCLRIDAQIPEGNWRGVLNINDTLDLPFNFEASQNQVRFINGEEKIIADEIKYSGDSMFIQMPVFDAEFRCRISGETLEGVFINHARIEKNVLAFKAVRGLSFRFSDKPERTSANITGKYRVVFDGEDEDAKVAVGVFDQSGNRVTGTFLTTTGDYRYLDGEVNGNRLWLSTFDGFHLYLFTAIVKGDSLTDGHFFSGHHWHDTWRAKKDMNAELPDADKFTHAKGNSKFELTFVENGKKISLSDEKFKDKAVIIQIMGTWCPNCMDETKFLSEWYNSRKKKKVEVVALDFERRMDSSIVSKNIDRLKMKFDIRYPVIFYGSSDKKEAAKTLPMIDRVYAFPTLIFLDKEKRIVKIHSGFSGPATGEQYTKFKDEFKVLVEQLN